MTVTAPLDMGTGQQRYVVAYTLKQGIEKQPDILNAQKSMYNFKYTCIHTYILLPPEALRFHKLFIFFYFSSHSFRFCFSSYNSNALFRFSFYERHESR